MVNILLICFKKSSKNLKFFNASLKTENIDYEKQSNGDWYNYSFNERDINIIKYYIIYHCLVIQNEEYFIKDYIKLHKNLSDVQKTEFIQLQRHRFGK